MKRSASLFRNLLVAALLVGGSAALAADATANASADIVTSISIAKASGGDLDFGDVLASGTAGTVTVSTAGARTAGGGATLGNADGARQATFTVTGDSGATYAITLPASTTLQVGADTTKQMTVDQFASDPSGTGTLTAGTQTLNVGARLNVGINQAAGAYTGTFTVTVAYN